MDANNLVSSRQPIECIGLEDKSTFGVIYEKFDMFREVLTNELNDSIKFAYLEHLLRLSTDPSETENALAKFKEPLRSKFQTLYDSRLHLLQGVIHGLDLLVLKPDLQGLLVEMVNFNYFWTGSKLNVQRTDFGKLGKPAISYTFSFKSKVYIMYTPQMTYIDGFDPFTGSTKIPIFSNSMIRGLAKDFYTNAAVTVEIQTDSNAKRTETRGSVAINSPRSSVRSSRKGEFLQREQNRSPMPKEKQKSISSSHFEETKSPRNEFEPIQNHNENNDSQELQELEEEFDEEDESLQEPDDDESYQSSFEQNLEIKKPHERTWEKFQKRAIEKQKERDQCGPGDCVGF